jgi:prepilin-type N-terminal cleavage/methylation domain-containing protein
MLTRRLSERREDGYTLVELLVVMILMGLVGTVIVGGVVATNRTTSAVSNRTQATADLEKTVERMGREIRVADPLEAGTATSSSVQVRNFRNGQCSRIGYYLSGTTLMQETQTGLTPSAAPIGSTLVTDACSSNLTATPPTTGAGVRTAALATGLDTSLPLFTYYGINGAQLASPITSSLVARVAIQVKLTATSSRPARTIQTSVQLRNFKPPTS